MRIRLLGGVNLRLDDAQVAPLESARAESLLAYLVLHSNAAQSRQRLAFLLWPDSSEPQALTNLRHVLYNLRRALPDAERYIEVLPRTLRWRTEAPLWLDVAVFEQAVAEGRLQDAIEMYGGPLLEGSYEEWLLDKRERLAQLHVDALERLARRLEEEGRWSDAIRYAEQLLRQDPLREEIYRLLMRLHAACGDPALALRDYHICAATLQRELGIEPSTATREAYEALLPVAPDLRPHLRWPGSLAGPPFIGRTVERARLTEVWRAVAQDSSRLLIVTGEPGVGKSRLVEELRSWCAHHGAVTAEARAYAAEGAVAYGVLAAWLRSPPVAERLRRLNRPYLTELARLLPELLAAVPDLPPPESHSEGEQRHRLFDAAARAIFTPGAPMLLVADDLQWCDVQTLQFIHYAIRGETAARLLVAATARHDDIDARHPASDLLAGLQALGRMSEIRLQRLGREETGILATRVAGRPLTESETDRLYDESEGNPLFLIEALRADPARAVAHGAEGSSKVQAIIAARLAQLSEAAGEIVGLAATIGREFTTQVLADASGADERSFVRGLDELWRRGIVRAHGASTYDFSHGKIREAAYSALSPARMRHYHLRVAQALERSRTGNLDPLSGEIAVHYDRAGAAGEAVEWYMRAADVAQRLHANGDAVRSLERALQLARDLPVGTGRATVELKLLAALPAPLVAIEGYRSDRVAEVHERAFELAEALAIEPEAPLIRSLAVATLTRGDFEAARPLGEQLRARAERDRDDVLWVESAYVLGIAAYWQGHLGAAREHFEAGVGRYRAEQRNTHLMLYGQDPEAVCLMRLAHTLWLLGREDEAGRKRDTAIMIAEQSQHPYTRAVTAAWAALIALDQYDEERLRRNVQVLDLQLSASGPLQIRRSTEALAGYLDVLAGNVEGIERVRHAFLESRDGEPAAPGATGYLMRVLLETYVAAGAAQTGLAAAEEALEMGGGAQLWEAEIRRLRAEFLATLGASPKEIEAELSRAAAVAERQGARVFELRARKSLDRLRAKRF